MSPGETRLRVTIGAQGFTAESVADEVRRVLDSYAKLRRAGQWRIGKVEVIA